MERGRGVRQPASASVCEDGSIAPGSSAEWHWGQRSDEELDEAVHGEKVIQLQYYIIFSVISINLLIDF